MDDHVIYSTLHAFMTKKEQILQHVQGSNEAWIHVPINVRDEKKRAMNPEVDSQCLCIDASTLRLPDLHRSRMHTWTFPSKSLDNLRTEWRPMN